MAKKYKYSFTRKKEAGEGYVAIGLAIASLISMAVVSIISFFFMGKGDAILGAIGLVSFLLAVYGLGLGIFAMSKKNSGHRMAVIGSIFSGIVGILWITIFVLGIN